MKSTELSKTYDPSVIEQKRYQEWEGAGYFHLEATDPRPPFCIVIPPPNVTGVLHMGHALDCTLQDILVRYYRMNDCAALWLPGTDHAGIATQVVVENILAREGTSRHELGREKFLQRVWKWKEESGNHILRQLRRLGASCDFQRERFTLDEQFSRAVRTVFVRLFEEGLIYQAEYLISWCPRCQTALSDLEVEYQEVQGALTYFDYETVEGKRITVATTRPETMLGDTAIAVHPKDRRFRGWIGKMVQHPFLRRQLSIIGDESVDPKFGTGAVKVTPAHDPNDYEIALRHSLPFVTVLDSKGCMNENAGPYKGLPRFEARERVVQDLKSRNLFVKTEPHVHAVGHCQRCKEIVEPRISLQWFVKVKSLAHAASTAVKKKQTVFVPDSWTKTYLQWMANIRDWCISRQLWWGHQIPVWYCAHCSKKTITVVDPTHCGHCGSSEIKQDEDVLDTWFSSALWPLATLGWPDATPDFKKFYPTSVLVTGFDIIFFWVARMMMMGIKFTGKVPFKTVHIHALVRDEKGQKMSKSRGNVVDPLEVMDRYGTDAFRFTLAALALQGRDIALSEKRIEGYRNFVTKLWNAARFALMHLSTSQKLSTTLKPKSLPDRWIRSRLNRTTKAVRESIEQMKFNEAAELLYQFIWHEYCDWYLEMIKGHLAVEEEPSIRASTLSTLAVSLDRILRLLHPICPFVTEEIWQLLPVPKLCPSIMLSDYPKPDRLVSSASEKEFDVVRKTIETVRQIRSENRIAPSTTIPLEIRAANGSTKTLKILRGYLPYIKSLSRAWPIEIAPTRPRNALSAFALAAGVEISVPLGDFIDINAERERLEKDRSKAVNDCDFLEKRLADPNYRNRAPAQLIERDKAKLKDAQSRLEKIDRTLSDLRS